MRFVQGVVLVALVFSSSLALGQGAPGAAADDYHFKTKQLTRAEVDALLATPDKVVFIELRRPDQVAADGSFPVYLAILSKDLEKGGLAYIPKDRQIVTVGLHARFGGAAGDLLTSKGFKVAGAVGIEDYIKQGGTIARVEVPPPRPAAAVK